MLGSYLDRGNPVAAHPLNDGLLAWWQPLRNAAGGATLFDLKGAYPATLNNFAAAATGTSGWGGAYNGLPTLRFDGSVNYLSAAQTASGQLVRTYDFTWEIWFRPDPSQSGTYRALMSGKYGTTFFRLNPSNQVDLLISQVADLGSSTATVAAGAWHHLAITQTGSGGTRNVYIDGVNCLSQSGGLVGSDGLLYVLKENGNYNAAAGDYGGAAVFGRGLSADEVCGRYAQYARGLPDLLSRWSRRTWVVGQVQTYTAGGGLAPTTATLSGAATFTAPTYTAAASLTPGSATLSGAATFTTPTYTAAVSLSGGQSSLIGAAAFTTPTYTAAVSLLPDSGVLAAAGAFTAPTYPAGAALTPDTPVLSATATFTVPSYTSVGDLSSVAGQVAGTGATTQPVFTTAGLLGSLVAEVSGQVGASVPVYAAAAGFVSGTPVLSATAAFTVPVYTAAAALSPAGSQLAGAGGFTAPTYTTSAGLNPNPGALAGVGFFSEFGVGLADGGPVFYSPAWQVVRVWRTDSLEPVRRSFTPAAVNRAFFWNGGQAVAQDPAKGETVKLTRKENKTLGISFEAEGAVRDGAVLSDPVVTIVKYPGTAGSPTVPAYAGEEIIPVGQVFTSDDRKIRGGRGVRVRVDATGATPGKYVLSCTVQATPAGGGTADTLEGGGVLVVE